MKPFRSRLRSISERNGALAAGDSSGRILSSLHFVVISLGGIVGAGPFVGGLYWNFWTGVDSIKATGIRVHKRLGAENPGALKLKIWAFPWPFYT